MAGEVFTFSQVPTADIPRSSFNRSHGHKTTFDAGLLIPFFADEVLPGDSFQVNVSAFARLATPIVPVMDNMHMDFFFFFVPNRLLWDNWQRFCGEQDNPGDSTDFQVPYVVAPAGGWAVQSIYDYLGLPVGKAGIEAAAFHLRAYNLIYNEWFRDENLCSRAVVNKDDGPDGEVYFVQKRGKRHDYFTSALPWPQKGPGVELGIGSSAPVSGNIGALGAPTFKMSGLGIPGAPLDAAPGATTTENPVKWYNAAAGTSVTNPLEWDDPKLAFQNGIVDLSQAGAVTINKLREAFQVQKLLERDARGGTRYTELLRSHFGVVSPDSRLQRPEYLGGGSIPVILNPVAQTSGTPQDSAGYAKTPQGNLAAYGVAGGKGIGFTKAFVEHGVILGLVMVRADLSYQQGLARMWSRKTRYDFYWPAFSHLGEQTILNKEIYAQGPAVLNGNVPPTPVDDDVFGYQERWAEYRYFPSKITGKFRSGIAGGSLDFWHLAQEFTALPTLGATFIQENPPVSRIVAVTNEPQFIFDSHISMKCTRPMPTFSVPGLIDHF